MGRFICQHCGRPVEAPGSPAGSEPLCPQCGKATSLAPARVRETREHPGRLLGASPRGSLGLFRAAQAMAAIQGKDSVSLAQVKALAKAVLAHRLIVRQERTFRCPEGSAVIEEILGELSVASQSVAGSETRQQPPVPAETDETEGVSL